MAQSPTHYDLLTEHGVTRVQVRYRRPFRQTVRVELPPKDNR